MKKTKIIALALIVSIMLVGAGYAAWTDTLEIKHTISTGNLDMQFACTKIMDSSKLVKVDEKVSDDKKSICFDINNMYPGASYFTYTREKNTGTIPAAFDNIKINVEKCSNQELAKKFLVTCYCRILDSNGNIVKYLPSVTSVPLNELESKLNEALKGVTLLPGECISFSHSPNQTAQCMAFELDESAGNDTELSKLTFTILINWKQHTHDK